MSDEVVSGRMEPDAIDTVARPHEAGLQTGVPSRHRGARTDELGAGRLVTSESIAAALKIPVSGSLFDLDPGRFNGMPRDPLSPPFQMVTYRTPHGIRVQGDVTYLQAEVNPTGTAWIDELMIGTVHCGAHIDALSHVTRGAPGEWHDGFSADEDLGDFGPLKADASKIPPIIARGVLIDVAGSRGEPELPEGYEIRAKDLEEALTQQGTVLRQGDVILVRTGQMRRWPDEIDFSRKAPGVVLEAAQLMSSAGPLAVGSDTSGFETREARGGLPNTVHMHLLVDRGIYIMEWLYLEDLARTSTHEFLFIALPLKIQGATGSWIRPVCIA